ncbi:MAG TPA: iron-sulfur cluster assembly scaffold protein [Blastocatellia bacterium]|nr:iron-sulfur cluster assembly scaffold protein [Blastocatellia bacterium]
MYSAKVLHHLENPHNVGELADATVTGQATNPVCGDLLNLQLKIADGAIVAAKFTVQGCPPSIAAGSALTEMLTGLAVAEARKLVPSDVTRSLESLPRNKEHCSVLAIDALRSALATLAEPSSNMV